MSSSTINPSNSTENSTTEATTSPVPSTEAATTIPTSITTSPSTPSSMSGDKIAAIVVSVGIFIIFMVLLAYFLLRRRRRNMNKPPRPVLPSAHDVGTRKHRDSDSDPSYMDPEPKHYVDIPDSPIDGVLNPAFDEEDEQDDQSYEVPVQPQVKRSTRKPPQPVPQEGEELATPRGVEEEDDEDDAQDYVNSLPKQQDEDYEIPETNKQQQPALENQEYQDEAYYFDMTLGRDSRNPPSQECAEPRTPPPPPAPCKPSKHPGYVNEQVSSDVHPGPSFYQNISMPNLSGSASSTRRPLGSTAVSVHMSRGTPKGKRREAPYVAENKSEDEDSNSYENVPDKKQRPPKT